MQSSFGRPYPAPRQPRATAPLPAAPSEARITLAHLAITASVVLVCAILLTDVGGIWAALSQ